MACANLIIAANSHDACARNGITVTVQCTACAPTGTGACAMHITCAQRWADNQLTADNADSFTAWENTIGHAIINSSSVGDVSDCTPPFPASVQVLCPGRSHFEIVSFPSQHFEGAEAANSSQIRDRSPLVRRMSYRTIHQRRSGARVRHVQFPFRRGVPPSQRQPQSDTEIPAWGSTCCAHDTQKLSSDENVEEVTEPFIAR